MAYNQKKQAGRGPMQKTGAGVPSALLQSTDPTDPKKVKHPGYKKPVYKKPFKGENLTTGQSFSNYDSKQYFDKQAPLDSIREVRMKGNWPKVGDRINTNNSRNAPGTYSTVKSINSETGDYTVRGKNAYHRDTKVVSRKAIKRQTLRQMSWKKS